MVFQFIDDIQKHVSIFNELLNKNGILIFAVFNPEIIKQYSKKGIDFAKIEKYKDIEMSNIKLKKNILIPVYIRSERDYKNIFEKYSFIHKFTEYPPFTEEFVKKYGWTDPYDVPEFMIMTFEKKELYNNE